MIERTSNPFGSVWAANIARKTNDESWKMDALVFSTNFHLDVEVEEFQTILPKYLIHHVTPGEKIYNFFEAWKRTAAETISAKTYGRRQWFAATAQSLARRGDKVNLQKKWASKGWLIWEQ